MDAYQHSKQETRLSNRTVKTSCFQILIQGSITRIININFVLYCLLEDQKRCIRGCEYSYLGVKISKEDRYENDIKNRINKCIPITAMLNGVLWNRQITKKNYK